MKCSDVSINGCRLSGIGGGWLQGVLNGPLKQAESDSVFQNDPASFSGEFRGNQFFCFF